MFELTEFGQKIFSERHAFNDGRETWEEGCGRVSRHIASAEQNGYVKTYSELFYGELVSNRFHPGGRIWYGAGRPKGQMLNCYVLPNPADSAEGWGTTVSETMIVSMRGGGVGCNFSSVRPNNSLIRGHSGKATGAVSLMRCINATGNEIRAGGGRRTALMLCLNHDHPDLLEFMDEKLERGALNNANVSVVFMNESPESFLRKVDNDELHSLTWNGEVKAQIPARAIWKRIVENAVSSGEPGILNGWLANQESNIYYAEPLVSTNPCGEIWLSGYECCDLGALVLPRFIVDGQMDLRQLSRTIHLAVRFLDNVLDVNTYPMQKIEDTNKQYRRIGLGVMGLHDMLILMGIKYGSEQALETIDWLFSFIKHKAYEASLFLAAEKGQFPAMDRAKFVESGFCKRLKESIRENILRFGMRNCTTMTIAPTGTTSIVAGVTSGIEPMYSYAYRRRWRQDDKIVAEVIEHPLFTALKHTPSAKLFESALEIDVEQHIAVQAVAQQHVDSAISKTINLPRNYTGEDMDTTIRKYIGRLKGLTMYRDGARGDSPIEPLTLEDAMQTECRSGVCEL